LWANATKLRALACNLPRYGGYGLAVWGLFRVSSFGFGCFIWQLTKRPECRELTRGCGMSWVGRATDSQQSLKVPRRTDPQPWDIAVVYNPVRAPSSLTASSLPWVSKGKRIVDFAAGWAINWCAKQYGSCRKGAKEQWPVVGFGAAPAILRRHAAGRRAARTHQPDGENSSSSSPKHKPEPDGGLRHAHDGDFRVRRAPRN